MDGLVILVAGLFLDFAAALTLIVPIPKLSSVLRQISTLQQAVMSDASGQSFDWTFSLQEDYNSSETMHAELARYEKQLFPYGIAFLVVGFAFVVAGVMIGS